MLTQGRTDAHAAGLDNIPIQQADAQTHSFDDSAFDAVISRFGIMFFDDPAAAFTNSHYAARVPAHASRPCAGNRSPPTT